jgi:hypothetical protein
MLCTPSGAPGVHSSSRRRSSISYEKRCYIRDPGGHLIEVGQTTDPDGDWLPAQWSSDTPAG